MSNLSRKTIEITTIQAGQPRAYADSIYEAVIEFDYPDHDKLKLAPARSTVEQIVRLFVRNWDDTGWHNLEQMEEIEKGKWHVKVVWKYDD